MRASRRRPCDAQGDDSEEEYETDTFLDESRCRVRRHCDGDARPQRTAGRNSSRCTKTRSPGDGGRPPAPIPPKLEGYKKETVADIDNMAVFTQQMIDQGLQLRRTRIPGIRDDEYPTDILKKNGFTIQENLAGIPTAWMASWGSGKPVIALGSRYRRHPAGFAETRCRLARADDSGRPVTVKATTRACRSTSRRRSP